MGAVGASPQTPKTTLAMSGLTALAGATPIRGPGAAGATAMTQHSHAFSQHSHYMTASAAAAAGQSKSNEDRDSLMQVAPEAQWMLAILDDMASKLSNIEVLTPEILQDKLDSVDPNVIVILKRHFSLEEKYDATLTAYAGMIASAENNPESLNLPGGDLADDNAEVPQSAAEIAESLRACEITLADSTRTVTRVLATQPLITRKLRAISSMQASESQASTAGVSNTRSTLYHGFGGYGASEPESGSRTATTVSQLRHSESSFSSVFARLRPLIYETMKLSADEEAHIKRQLDALHRQSIIDQQEIERLTAEGAEARSLLERSSLEYGERLARLSAQLNEVHSQARSDRQALEARAENDRRAAELEFLRKEAELRESIARLDAALKADLEKHDGDESRANRNRDNIDQQITDVIASYDDVMMEKHKRLHRLLLTYEKESREYKKLSMYFRQKDAEDARLALEDQARLISRDKQTKVERAHNEASIFMDTMLTGFDERAERAAKLAAKIAKEKAAKKK